jgi:hypothetical protein
MADPSTPGAVRGRFVAVVGGIALVAGVATAAFVIIAGTPTVDTTPPVANAPTASASPSPTSTPSLDPTPTPSTTATNAPPTEAGGPFVNGFDARQVYRSCIEATPEITGFGEALVPDAFSDDSVKAGVDPYTRDNIPESEWPTVATVYVNWPTGSTPVADIVALCTVSGSPESPTVTFDRTLS